MSLADAASRRHAPPCPRPAAASEASAVSPCAAFPVPPGPHRRFRAAGVTKTPQRSSLTPGHLDRDLGDPDRGREPAQAGPRAQGGRAQQLALVTAAGRRSRPPAGCSAGLLTARAGKVQPETAGRRHPNAVPGWLAGAAGTLLGVPSEIGLRAARRPTRGPAGARRSRAGGRAAARSLPEHSGGKGRARTHVLSLGAAGPGPHVCNPPPDPGRKVGGPKGERRPGDCEDAAG